MGPPPQDVEFPNAPDGGHGFHCMRIPCHELQVYSFQNQGLSDKMIPENRPKAGRYTAVSIQRTELVVNTIEKVEVRVQVQQVTRNKAKGWDR